VNDDIRHGTNTGYRQHRRAGTDACLLCLHAHATYNRLSRYRLESHGTREGLNRHALNGTPVCDLCLDLACALEHQKAQRLNRSDAA
jgi:hypothetical protein